MGTQRVSDQAVDWAAAACLGAAVGWSLLRLADNAAMALATGALTVLTARRSLAWLGGAPELFAVPPFALPEIAAPDELLLTVDQIVAPLADDSPLLLDDVLAEPAPDARVVRLFDAVIPTAGELQRRIDLHLLGRPPPPIPDATEALHQALAVLRRSLA